MILSFIVAMFVIAAVAIAFSGCKSVQPVVIPQVKVEQVHDTTLLHDSVYLDRVHTVYTKGDTIYMRDSVYLFKYKYLDKVQVVEHIDSIAYPVEVQVPVRQRNWYDRATSWGFWLLFVGFLACVAFKIAKVYLTHKL